MRKLLLGTSALIGATALVASATAAAPELTISGNLNFEWQGGENAAWTIDEDTAEVKDRGHAESGWNFGQASSLSEIKFFAEGESDGGLTYGADVQYRYTTSSVDEAYIFVSGEWGTVHLGQDDGAVNQTRFYAGSIAPGGYLIDGFTIGLAPKSIRAYSDDNKILYVSNDLNGFKFALSVEGAADATGSNASQAGDNDLVTAIGLPVSTAAERTARNAALVADHTAAFANINGGVQYEDQYEIGASYTHDFGDGHFGVSIGYQTADAADNEVGGQGLGGLAGVDADVDDREEYIVGFKAGFGPVSFAGSYADAGESGTSSLQQADGGEAGEIYTLGVAYDLGGGMGVGISYGESERTNVTTTRTAADARTGAVVTEITRELITIDFGFPIMEGMSGYAGIAFSEQNATTTVQALAAADDDTASLNTDATTYVIGTTVSF